MFLLSLMFLLVVYLGGFQSITAQIGIDDEKLRRLLDRWASHTIVPQGMYHYHYQCPFHICINYPSFSIFTNYIFYVPL